MNKGKLADHKYFLVQKKRFRYGYLVLERFVNYATCFSTFSFSIYFGVWQKKCAKTIILERHKCIVDIV